MTSVHEFFGISLIETMYCNTIPIIPNNLVYIEHFESVNYTYFYNHKSKGDLVKKLIGLLENMQCDLVNVKNVCKQIALKYHAFKICEKYDKAIIRLNS
eukprot:67014_1